jgi:hypothetical protein
VYRPVRPIEEGIVRAVGATLSWPAIVSGVDARVRFSASRLDGRSWLSGDVWLQYDHGAAWRNLDLRLDARAGFAGDDAPPQALMLLGGRGSLPGHPLRSQVGDRYWLARARLGRMVAAPWFGVHLEGAVGRAFIDGPDVLPLGWTGDPDAGVRGSLGLGVDLLWDVLTVDVARGLGPEGDWALILGVSPRFHPWL